MRKLLKNWFLSALVTLALLTFIMRAIANIGPPLPEDCVCVGPLTLTPNTPAGDNCQGGWVDPWTEEPVDEPTPEMDPNDLHYPIYVCNMGAVEPGKCGNTCENSFLDGYADECPPDVCCDASPTEVTLFTFNTSCADDDDLEGENCVCNAYVPNPPISRTAPATTYDAVWCQIGY
jgi:hypothetical protein